LTEEGPYSVTCPALENRGCLQSEYTANEATITLATIIGGAFIQMPYPTHKRAANAWTRRIELDVLQKYETANSAVATHPSQLSINSLH
jgi:hypothetical protein